MLGQYPDAKMHVRDKQPASTRGKLVMYRTYQGFWHAPYYADQLNWATKDLGRIFEYRIVK